MATESSIIHLHKKDCISKQNLTDAGTYNALLLIQKINKT